VETPGASGYCLEERQVDLTASLIDGLAHARGEFLHLGAEFDAGAGLLRT